MRISDWSSDVCSSDLFSQTAGNWFKAGPGPGLRKTRIFCCPPGHNGGSKMTDDLTRGYEDQDANVTESAETVASETGAQATQPGTPMAGARSEEHTSELQSLMRISYAVFCLKKKRYINK